MSWTNPKIGQQYPWGGGDPAQEQYVSTVNLSWDTREWKCSNAALWKMRFPSRFTALGDGDVQSLSGFTWDSRGWGQQQLVPTSTWWVMFHLVASGRNWICWLIFWLET